MVIEKTAASYEHARSERRTTSRDSFVVWQDLGGVDVRDQFAVEAPHAERAVSQCR
jgi:hypothetical protein